MIPYFCWNIIAILIVIGLKLLAFYFKGKPLSNILSYFQENGWLHLLWDNNVWGTDCLNWLGIPLSMSGPSDFPLWFVRDLIVDIFVLTPVIFFYLKYTRFYGLILLAIAYISHIWPNIPGISIEAVFFFSIGSYYGINCKNLILEFAPYRIPSYIVAFCLLCFTVWFDGINTKVGSFIYPLFIISGVIAVFNISAQMIKNNKIKVRPLLSKSTFFIYAVHTLFILNISSCILGKIVGNNTIIALIISYITIPILTVGICLCLFCFMRKFMPRLLNILIGQRL